jgi:hypothetical protein
MSAVRRWVAFENGLLATLLAALVLVPLVESRMRGWFGTGLSNATRSCST